MWRNHTLTNHLPIYDVFCECDLIMELILDVHAVAIVVVVVVVVLTAARGHLSLATTTSTTTNIVMRM